MKNKTLYIIGNGFDLYHGLGSTYDDFHKYVKEQFPDTEDFLNIYFNLRENNDSLWSDFENDLETFDYELFFDNNSFSLEEWMEQEYPQWGDWDASSDALIEESESQHKNIKVAFVEWVNSLSNRKISKRNLFFESDSLFLSFNYTPTLEKLYNIPKVVHIHGYINDRNEENLVFGHGMEALEGIIPELDENGESNRTPDWDARANSRFLFYQFQKPVKDIINENQSFFDSLKYVERVVVLGHSLNKIDRSYFDKISKNTSDKCKWVIVYFNDADGDNERNTISAMKDIGICDQQYELLTWDKYDPIETAN